MSLRRAAFIFLLVSVIAINCSLVFAQNPTLITEKYNGLTIYYEDNIGQKNVQFVRDTWDKCMTIYTETLKVKPDNEEVDVSVFGTRSGYRQILIAHGLPESWVFSTLGVAQNKSIFINLEACTSMVKKEKYQLLAHEFAHIWSFKLNGSRLEDCWLVEGYAYYWEKKTLDALGLDTMQSILRKSLKRTKANYLPQLETMQTQVGFIQAYKKVDDDDLFRAYMVTVIDYLLSIKGQDSFNQYFSRRLPQEEAGPAKKREDGTVILPSDFENNFLSSFGMDVPTFQAKFTEYLRKAKP